MITSMLRRTLLPLILFGALTIAGRAQTTYYGSASIDLNSLSPGGHTIVLRWDNIVGGNVYTYAYGYLGGFTAASSSHIGEATIYIYLNNIHQYCGSWVADSVDIYEGKETTLTPWSDYQVYYRSGGTNVTVPSTVSASGYGYWGNDYYPIVVTVY